MREHPWYTTIPVSDPNDVRRAVQLCNGVRAWDTPQHREVYQVGRARVEIVELVDGWRLVISAPESGVVLDGAARLGYAFEDVTIVAVEWELVSA